MRKILAILVTLLMSMTLLAQKMVGTVVLRNEDGTIKDYYANVTIISYEETEEGILTSVHFTTRGGKEYILCGVYMSLEDVKVVDQPTVVYVRPTYRYCYYDYWPSPRPRVRPVPPRPNHPAPPRGNYGTRPPSHYGGHSGRPSTPPPARGGGNHSGPRPGGRR